MAARLAKERNLIEAPGFQELCLDAKKVCTWIEGVEGGAPRYGGPMWDRTVSVASGQ
jgi:hypothetical protein